MMDGKEAFSLSLWFKADVISGPIFHFGNSSSLQASTQSSGALGWRSSTHNFSAFIWTTSAQYAESSKNYTDGTWHHAVVVLNSSALALFVDGVIVAKNTNANTGTSEDYTSPPYLWIAVRSKVPALPVDCCKKQRRINGY